MKPTDEQIKKLWEWCGFTVYEKDGGMIWWNYPDGSYKGLRLPPIDLNNLFKYAVPKLIEDGYRFGMETALADEHWYWWIIEKDANLWKADSQDPALALFWAIYEAVK